MVLSGAILSQQLRASRREGQQKGVWSLLQRGERVKGNERYISDFPNLSASEIELDVEPPEMPSGEELSSTPVRGSTVFCSGG